MFVILYVHDVSLLYFTVKLHRTKQRKNLATCQQSFPVYIFQWPAEQKASHCVLTPYRIRSLQRFGETYYFHLQGGRNWLRWMHKTTAWITAVMKTWILIRPKYKEHFYRRTEYRRAGGTVRRRAVTLSSARRRAIPRLKKLCTLTLVMWC
jgi:hypothetical protein